MQAFSSKFRSLLTALLLLAVAFAVACKSSSTGGILGPVDETAEAGKLVEEANADLKKIRVLYEQNEDKRPELKAALESNNEADVKRISAEVVQIINEGTNFGNSAIDKISEAQDMQINEQYKEYLRLKQEALKKQLEAFAQYHQAARVLRDNYDPKNAQNRDKVKTEFDTRSEKYRELMEKARDNSSEANELYKDTVRQQRQN
jgi:hypothetical protein